MDTWQRRIPNGVSRVSANLLTIIGMMRYLLVASLGIGIANAYVGVGDIIVIQRTKATTTQCWQE